MGCELYRRSGFRINSKRTPFKPQITFYDVNEKDYVYDNLEFLNDIDTDIVNEPDFLSVEDFLRDSSQEFLHDKDSIVFIE